MQKSWKHETDLKLLSFTLMDAVRTPQNWSQNIS